QALEAANEKERQRVAAEAAQKTAENKVVVVGKKLDVAEGDLAQKNKELEAALAESKLNEERAKSAAVRDESEEKKAVVAAEDAQRERVKADEQRVRAESAEKAAKERAD